MLGFYTNGRMRALALFYLYGHDGFEMIDHVFPPSREHRDMNEYRNGIASARHDIEVGARVGDARRTLLALTSQEVADIVSFEARKVSESITREPMFEIMKEASCYIKHNPDAMNISLADYLTLKSSGRILNNFARTLGDDVVRAVFVTDIPFYRTEDKS